jgi:hypothetical protein
MPVLDWNAEREAGEGDVSEVEARGVAGVERDRYAWRNIFDRFETRKNSKISVISLDSFSLFTTITIPRTKFYYMSLEEECTTNFNLLLLRMIGISKHFFFI